jgi:hypothetical protein
MRLYQPTTQTALLNWLSDMLRENPEPKREVELWRVRKGERELTCIAVYQAYGIDVRLMEGDGFRRTILVNDAAVCNAVSDEWMRKLVRLDGRPDALSVLCEGLAPTFTAPVRF